MATNPEAADTWQSQPSIIIDPSIYVADASSDPLRTRVLGALGTMVWATAAGLVISVTVFAITLSNGWLVHGINHDPSHVAFHFAFGHDAHAQEVAAPRPVTTGRFAPSTSARRVGVAAPALVPSAIEAAPAVQAPLAPAPVSAESAEALVEMQNALRDGRKQLLQRRYDEAEQSFRTILAVRPNHPGALSGMARIKLARGELDPALGLARRAVSVAPSHAVYHAILGDVLRAFGEPAAADLEYEIASRLSQGTIDRVEKALPANPYATRPEASRAVQAESEPDVAEPPAASAPEIEAAAPSE